MKQTNKNKGVIVTLVLTLLLLVTGTFAWTSFTQRALNENDGEIEPGGRIHDDYRKEDGNKDIYAENYGEQNLLVRIKLSEYFEKNGQPLVADTTKEGRDSWIPYVLPETTAPSSSYRPFVTWELGGDKTFLPTFNTNKSDLSTDAAGDAIDFATGTQTAEGNGEHDYYTDGEEVADPFDDTVVHKAKKTLTQEKAPISMAEWKALPKKDRTGNFWVIDTDGWAYWAELLAPKESTSLLLNQLTFNGEELANFDEWYYGIDVLGEFATLVDRDKFHLSDYGEPSEDALSLLDNVSREETFTYEVKITSNTPAMTGGTSKNLTAKATRTSSITELTEDISQQVVWSISGQNTGNDLGTKTAIDAAGKLTAKPFEKSEIEVTATLTDADAKDTTNVEVSPIQVGAKFDFFGEEYIYAKDKGSNNRLILRNHLLLGKHPTVLNYNGGVVDNGMKEYYNKLPNEAKEVVQPVQESFTVGKGGSHTSGQLVVPNAPNDRATVNAKGEKKAFALSVAELNDISGKGKVFPNIGSRIATDDDSPKGFRSWYLRTNYNGTSIWYVTGQGTTYQTGPTLGYGMRPAMIINQ